MGCSGYSKISKSEVNGGGSVYRRVTKELIHIEVGDKVRILDSGPTIVFVYGGPGSKKGRLVSELVEVFDFTFVNVEKMLLERVGSGGDSCVDDAEPRQRKESMQELKKIAETDPDSISLAWILREVSAIVAQNPQGRYLVDMMPNLKYLHRGASFSRDCSAALRTFELKYPISFGLYFSLTMGSKAKNQPVEVEEEKIKEGGKEEEKESSGFQTDEVDISRTKKRQSMFEQSVHSLLAYFLATHRLLTVDVSSKDADAAASRTCHVLSGLNLMNLKLVNTVLIFIFDPKSVDPDLLSSSEVELFRLELPGQRLSVDNLDDAIKSFVNKLNHKEHKTFVVDLSCSNIAKNAEVEVSKSSITFVNEAPMGQYFDIPGCQGLYKSVSSLENAVCVFPEDTNPNLCKKIAVSFNDAFSTPREKIEKSELV